jgi:heme/copper-type cytochrome/quinol oxidase subunit 1
MGLFIIIDMFFGLGCCNFLTSSAGLSTITVALIGLSLIFFSLHFLGFNTMPRRYVDYSDNLRLFNRIATTMLIAFLLAPLVMYCCSYHVYSVYTLMSILMCILFLVAH